MNEFENQPADNDASGEIPRPTFDGYEDADDPRAPGWGAPSSDPIDGPAVDTAAEPVDVTVTESAPSHAVRRTLIFTGAATAIGLLAGAGIAVARGGGDNHRAESAAESGLEADGDRTPVNAASASAAANAAAAGTAGATTGGIRFNGMQAQSATGSTPDGSMPTMDGGGPGAPGGPGGHHGHGGPGGHHGQGMPGGDQSINGSQAGQPPIGAQPGGASSSSSHGS